MTHGGKNKVARAKANRVIAQQQALSLAAKLVAYNEDDPESPIEGLLREVRWSGQVARALGDVCNELLSDNTLTTRSISGERMNVLMDEWAKERERHARFCKMALDAGVEQKQIDVLEQQGAQIVAVLLALLMSPELNLTSEQIINGRVAAARVLRGIDQGTFIDA
jgi:hypothetical protein